MKRFYHNDNQTRFCIQGALKQLGIFSTWQKPILESIREHFPERVAKWIEKHGELTIEDFNDSSKTTFAQVRKVLKDAELKFEMKS